MAAIRVETALAALCVMGMVVVTVTDTGAEMHALGDAVERQCADLGRRADADPALFRCLQLLRRLGRRRAGDDAWRAAFGRAVSRLTWGMPGCPVERKVEAGGGAMACNNIGEALGAYAHRPLLMHIVNDAMDWQHFDTGAVLACPHKCLWAGAVEPPGLADVFVYDCLQQPPRGGHTGRQALMLLCMESAAHLPRLEDPNFLRRFDITATYRRDSQVPSPLDAASPFPPPPPTHTLSPLFRTLGACILWSFPLVGAPAPTRTHAPPISSPRPRPLHPLSPP